MSTALQQIAGRLAVSEDEIKSIVMHTVMPNGGKQVTQDQFVTFVAVANEYKLNPLTKEIYAFPARGGGIQPVVSIDGWLKIINNHPQFNGMTFEDVISEDNGLIAVKCKIYKKEIEHPVEVVEYMNECRGISEPWKKWPSRMLRHKAAIQAGRYAFGLSGIIDPDEAERYKDAGVIQADVIDTSADEMNIYNAATLEDLITTWESIYKRYNGKSCLKQLTEAKDIRKKELQEEANA